MIATIELSLQEVYAGLCILGALGGVGFFIVKLILDRRYLRKSAFYAQRRDDEAQAQAEAEKAAEAKRAADDAAKEKQRIDDAAKLNQIAADKEFREDVLRQLSGLYEKVKALESEQQQAQKPISDLADAVRGMSSGLDTFQKEIAAWRLDLEKRFAVVEDRQKRGGHGQRG